MGFPINGDLLPTSSGRANLGVGVSPNAQDAFDAANIRPFNHVHLVSGVFHDPLHGQSGVLRFNQQQGAFQVSINGGLTFVNLSAGGVDSVGVIGGANLTGNVDFASASSGFIAITDTGGASPLFWAVNHLGLSGLWQFPPQGFNGRVVNLLTDFNGTSAQGVINVVGVSGIIVDIVGQTMTIAANTDVGSVARCYTETVASATTWVITHNLNTASVVVSVYDNSTPRVAVFPDRIEVTNANTVTIGFNVAQAGLVTVLGC